MCVERARWAYCEEPLALAKLINLQPHSSYKSFQIWIKPTKKYSWSSAVAHPGAMDYPCHTKYNSSGPELLQKEASSDCSALASGASSSPGTAVAAFCAALSSNSQPLPNSAWLYNISPLQPQQSLYTSAREHGISTPNLWSQDWLRHISLT